MYYIVNPRKIEIHLSDLYAPIMYFRRKCLFSLLWDNNTRWICCSDTNLIHLPYECYHYHHHHLHMYIYIYICKRLNVYSFGKPRETKRLCSIALLVITKEYPACFPIFSDTIQLQMPIPERCQPLGHPSELLPLQSPDCR